MQRNAPGTGNPALLKGCSRGFTLPELLLAMVFGSMIMIAAMQVYPMLRQQSQHTMHQFQLAQLLDQIVFSIEKDLRRAGFCAGVCTGNAVTVGQFAGETPNSCVVIAYDFDRRGGAPRNRETFGYRLRAGAIETQVAIADCAGGGWQRLLDPDVITVTQFHVRLRQYPGRPTLYEVRLAGHWPRRPQVQQHVVRWVAGRNA